MTTSGPDCTCGFEVFTREWPWAIEFHHKTCARFCDCYFRSHGFLGRRGNVVHFPECGWYRPPETSKPLPRITKGASPLFSVFDEWETPVDMP